MEQKGGTTISRLRKNDIWTWKNEALNFATENKKRCYNNNLESCLMGYTFLEYVKYIQQSVYSCTNDDVKLSII